MPPYFSSDKQLLEYALKLEGRRISEISQNITNLDCIPRNRTKSVIANIIETDYFGIPTNSYENPDFQELGIELKVSPLKYVKKVNLINAKERNVLGMVDYYDVLNNPIWQDNKRLACKLGQVLFVFYLHNLEKPASTWKVLSTFLWSPNKDEGKLIQNDYRIIRDKIIKGEKNSEKDNTILATCPKHQGGYDRNHPSSSKTQSLCKHPTMQMAERRGFCLRNNFITKLVATYGLGTDIVEKGNSIGISPTEFKFDVFS